MNTTAISFPGAQGTALSARLTMPADRNPRAWALMAHCFTCGKDLNATRWIAEGLADRGYGVLRFDFTGLGESEGDFADTDFTSNVADLVAAARWLKEEHAAPSLLVGHSLGGAAVVVAAGELPEVRAVAVIGAPSSTGHLAEGLLDMAPELATEDEAEVKLAGRPFRLRRDFVDDLKKERVLAAAAELGRPLMIFHSPFDETVDIRHARTLYEAAKHPKSFVSLDQADHLLLKNRADARFVSEMLGSWAARHLDAPDELPAPPEGTVEVETIDGFTNAVRARGHRLLADEPKSVGGADTGLAPFEWVLAGLGACTSMTLRMYADRKKWPLEDVKVSLEREKAPEKDGQDTYRRTIAISGPLDEEQRARLMEIADRCPVHRSLEHGPKIVTERADP